MASFNPIYTVRSIAPARSIEEGEDLTRHKLSSGQRDRTRLRLKGFSHVKAEQYDGSPSAAAPG